MQHFQSFQGFRIRIWKREVKKLLSCKLNKASLTIQFSTMLKQYLPAGCNSSNEKLWTIRVLTSISHGQKAYKLHNTSSNSAINILCNYIYIC